MKQAEWAGSEKKGNSPSLGVSTQTEQPLGMRASWKSGLEREAGEAGQEAVGTKAGEMKIKDVF